MALFETESKVLEITTQSKRLPDDRHFVYRNAEGAEYILCTTGRGTYIVELTLHTAGIQNVHIGRQCSVARNTNFLINQNHDYKRVNSQESCVSSKHCNIIQKGQIIIQNDVWIGFGATIMSGVTVRNGAVIAANSHVIKDVPPFAIVGGNPAKIIKYRFSDEIIADLQNIAWWNWDDTKTEACKDDFGLPTPEFVKKHIKDAKPTIPRKKPVDLKNPQILFFPDFDAPCPLWRHVIDEYCKNPIGTLAICLGDNETLDSRERELQAYVASVYQGKGEITEQIGGDEDELFAEADCYVTNRALETVRRTCLADKYGVKIVSCCDVPFLYELKPYQ
jgi:virginiamycin A acetyltransferase